MIPVVEAIVTALLAVAVIFQRETIYRLRRDLDDLAAVLEARQAGRPVADFRR